jgi:hypothetical protein
MSGIAQQGAETVMVAEAVAQVEGVEGEAQEVADWVVATAVVQGVVASMYRTFGTKARLTICSPHQTYHSG